MTSEGRNRFYRLESLPNVETIYGTDWEELRYDVHLRDDISVEHVYDMSLTGSLRDIFPGNAPQGVLNSAEFEAFITNYSRHNPVVIMLIKHEHDDFESILVRENEDSDEEVMSDDDSDQYSDEEPIPISLVEANVKKRARILDEEETERKRIRGLSTGAKCMRMNDGDVCKYKPIISDDWCDVDDLYLYGPDSKKRCFDVTELLRHFESNLKTEKYGNPYPQYPHDPFSRDRFTTEELYTFMRLCKNVGVDVASIAPTFALYMDKLSNFAEWLNESVWREQVIDHVVRAQSGGSFFSQK